MIGKTVLLELEWAMRGYYGFSQPEVATVLRHLLGLHHVTIEDREVVEQALSNCDSGLDFADALHHASDEACESVATASAPHSRQKFACPGLVWPRRAQFIDISFQNAPARLYAHIAHSGIA